MSVARLGVMFVLSVLQSGMPDFFQCMRIQSLFCAVWLSATTDTPGLPCLPYEPIRSPCKLILPKLCLLERGAGLAS